MKRYAVVFVLFILSMITFVDRVCISAAKDPITSELGLSDAAMGFVFSAFALGYALAQIPSGWFADKWGPRLALTVVVALWSVLTALTGAAWNFTSLVIIRLGFGMAEAGAFPGSARAICNWLPTGERGRANGVIFSGARIGGAVSFPLLAWMLTQWHWRTSFLILGVLGTVWALFWFVWFRDWPAKPPHEAAAPAATGEGLSKILRSRPMAFALFQYFAGNFTFFICLSWMLPYLKRQYRLEDSQAAAYAMAPLLVGATSQWFAGWLVDRLYGSRYRVWSRRLPGIAGFALAAAGMFAVTRADSPGWAAACFTLAVFGADMTISPSWVFCADIAGKDTGRVSGAMNMLGNIGSFVSANAFPYLERVTGSASAYFLTAAVLNVLAIVCWFNMRSIGQANTATLSVAGPAGE
jgi:ACS family glucarate transporter-like MFS transporter